MTDGDVEITRALVWFGRKLEEGLIERAVREMSDMNPTTAQYTKYETLMDVARSVADACEELEKVLP